LAAKRPEDERRVLAAAPGKRKGRRRPLSKLRGCTETRRTPGPRVDRLSAHKNLRVCGRGGPAAGGARTALPPRATFVSAQNGRPDSSQSGASQLRDSAGFAPDFAASAPAGDMCPGAPSIGPAVVDRSGPFGLTSDRSPVKVARSSPVGLRVRRTWRFKEIDPLPRREGTSRNGWQPTADALLTMERRAEPAAAGGNGFRLFLRFQ